MDAVMVGLKAAPLVEAESLSPRAFDVIYGEHKAAVYRLACALTDDPRDAEDLFQETWLRAVRAGREEGCPGDVRSWLFTIASNLHRDNLRKKKVRRFFSLERSRAMTGERSDADAGWDSPGTAQRDVAARTDFQVCLRRALSKLPARQREVFVLKDVEGYKHEEIGRMLGIPEATVRTLLHRAVKSLQKDLAAFDPKAGRGGPERKRTDEERGS